jgi:hypothetical protein
LDFEISLDFGFWNFLGLWILEFELSLPTPSLSDGGQLPCDFLTLFSPESRLLW